MESVHLSKDERSLCLTLQEPVVKKVFLREKAKYS